MITIVLIFVSFFILQLFFNRIFFQNYYTTREIATFEENLSAYIVALDDAEEDDVYDIIFDFTQKNNADSVILSFNYRLLESSPDTYTIIVEHTETQEEYVIILPGPHQEIQLNNIVSFVLIENDDQTYQPVSINDTIYNDSCEFQTCIEIEAAIQEINKPNHLNYIFRQNQRIGIEVSKLSSSFLSQHEYGNDVYRYQSTDGPTDIMVYLHRVPSLSWSYVMTIVPIQNTSNIVGIVAAYQNYVYLTAVGIIFLWSFRISNVVSKPIKNIEAVAREIANLNFTVQALEANNKESTSLSNSINLIAKNLKSTIETINTKNTELTKLYNEQNEQHNLKKQLVSSISHELKTPLMIIQVTIEGIMDGIIDKEDIPKELTNVLKEVNKSSVMLQDLLQIYRLDDKNRKLDEDDINIHALLEDIIHEFNPLITRYSFKIINRLDVNDTIRGDKKLIQRVLSNLMTNALKYTYEKRSIEIRFDRIPEGAIFKVINEGPQIPAKDLENVWKPFFRIDFASEDRLDSKGTGIGLYLVSEILSAHGFDHGIENTKTGVEVYFKVPA